MCAILDYTTLFKLSFLGDGVRTEDQVYFFFYDCLLPKFSSWSSFYVSFPKNQGLPLISPKTCRWSKSIHRWICSKKSAQEKLKFFRLEIKCCKWAKLSWKMQKMFPFKPQTKQQLLPKSTIFYTDISGISVTFCMSDCR